MLKLTSGISYIDQNDFKVNNVDFFQKIDK